MDDETIRRHVKEYFKDSKLKPENGGSDSLNLQPICRWFLRYTVSYGMIIHINF